MRKLLFIFILFCCQQTFAQYNNEWIDYSKTYYKFKLAETGLCRINQPALPAALSAVPAEQFQLWRNGKQVALYTSVASGALGAGGYIEFWGEKNDGVPDKPLYLNAALQLSDKLSLETDTAAYFLTVNTNVALNLRFSTQVNDVAGNVLPAETYFMYAARKDYKDWINRGYAVNYGLYVYSSSYDEGEGWGSVELKSAILPSGSSAGSPAEPLNYSFQNLRPYTSGPASTLTMSVAGTAPNNRNIKATLNSNTIFNNALNNFSATIMSGNVTTTSITNSTQVTVTSDFTSTLAADRAVIGFIELNYPRAWDFNNQHNFEFSLPASSQKYIEVTNFNAGAAAPVLYDLTNNRRYIADIYVTGKYRFVLPADGARKFVLVSQSAGINNITSFQQRNFVNYASVALQGDYLIISHASLGLGTGQPVYAYMQYRSSANGGAYNAKIYDVDELIDQFAFGIRKHPLGIKNFLRYARNTFSVAPKMSLLIGRGVTYDEYQQHQGDANAEKLNLVPTFGYPGSDILLASNGTEPVPAIPIGRISAVTGAEVTAYLEKVTAYETAQRTLSQTIGDKNWMKNFIHVAGGSNQGEDGDLQNRLNILKDVIQDSLYGAKVYSFNKTTTGATTVINDALFSSLLKNGIGMLTYFGHGSTTSLAYNLPALNTWNNQGKYPLFLMLGCNVGNFFGYDVGRLSAFQNLSEQYVLTSQIGGIGMIASTHFGTIYELDQYAQQFYNAIGRTKYGQPVGVSMKEAAQQLQAAATTSYMMRLHLEQHLLHGDPAFKPNSFPKPDYVVEEPQVIINPTFISVADTVFNVKAYFYNIGKAVGNSASKVGVQVKRRYPDGTVAVVYTQDISPAIRNVDSIAFKLPVIATRDKGENRLIVTIDYNGQYDELSELNNTTEKIFFIYEDELRPVYPYNFAIINKNNAKLVASTADPFMTSKTLIMEMDTTELFNSPFKITRTIVSVGGVVEFDPNLIYKDSTVYYWRVAISPSSGAPHWNTSSFVYLNGTGVGFNQSHFYQHTKSDQNRMYIDTASRAWKYGLGATKLRIRNRIFRSGAGLGDSDFSISINNAVPPQIYSACAGTGSSSVLINVFDPVTMKPYFNQTVPSTVQSGTAGGFMQSASVCAAGREYNFQYSYADAANRAKIRDFLDYVPANAVVVIRINAGPTAPPFIDEWKNDATIYGAGNTLYDRLRSAGFVDIDSFSYTRSWVFVYAKNNGDFVPKWQFTQNEFDEIDMNLNVPSTDTLGYITSPKFGPAKAWQEVKWRGNSLENGNDEYTVGVIGVRDNGQEDLLYTLNGSQQDFNISSVNATTYPYIRLTMFNQDKVTLTPYQLRWWRLYYTPVPEGALAANLKFNFKDTLEAGEPLNLAIPFKNVSDVAFANTIKVNMSVRDQSNQLTTLTVPRLKAVVSGDTAMLTYQVNTENLSGANTLLVDINPDNDQPEQTHFNNFFYRTFVVKGDILKPTLDVTFDGIRILNRDIVSSKPHILVKLKDESKFLALNDTSLVTITLKYPDNTIRRFKFGTDTLKFTAATPGVNNEAMVDFTPVLTLDGEYELVVTGKDRSGNVAGNLEYRVLFQVYNTPMISNMFNYPNPFTTSTAFVFTLTGSVVPQNIRIQVLTVTGKIVREITKDELGPLNIGRNITQFKWDGTDQYGQKLANGVYLYRVITNLNGSSLDKFPTYDSNGSTVDTDKYFNKGYGKMYLMR